MYMTNGGVKKIGCNFVELTNVLPEFVVRNKLSSKPQKAAEKLKKMIEGSNSICKNYDLSIKQDYDKNTVRLNLLGQSIVGCPGGGYPANTERGQIIYQTSELPVTAAVKRYTEVVKQMVNNAEKG